MDVAFQEAPEEAGLKFYFAAPGPVKLAIVGPWRASNRPLAIAAILRRP